MDKFFNPQSVAVFGAGVSKRNLARNIIANCQSMGFQGPIFPVGRHKGMIDQLPITTDPNQLPEDIDLAVILTPAEIVPDLFEICGRKNIRRVIVSTGGFSEFRTHDNPVERRLIDAARRHNIRFIGPNCIGVISAESGLCTPFNPLETDVFKTGPISFIAQSGGIALQASYLFSDEHIGFNKIISAGNKLNLNEVDFLKYLITDNCTTQIHLYLESIADGQALLEATRTCTKPIVIYKSNTSQTAASIAHSHTAALANNDRVVDGALKQAGIIRVDRLQDMTVCAKALSLPPLRGNRLVAISLSGGFSVIMGDACERYGFDCPALPRPLMDQIETFRRGGVIRMSNPMDFGDIHNVDALLFALEKCLALDFIDGLLLSFMYGADIAAVFGDAAKSPDLILSKIGGIGQKFGKPIGLSFFAPRKYIDQLKAAGTHPVFNDPEESVRAFRMLYEWTRRQNTAD